LPKIGANLNKVELLSEEKTIKAIHINKIGIIKHEIFLIELRPTRLATSIPIIKSPLMKIKGDS
jgi:hypothetical protein